jgi:hypothetical protein
MKDPAHPGVTFGKSSEQPWWWDGSGGPVHVEPIWVAAERAHIRSGIMFWPGSTTAIDGIRASDWQAYHADLPNHERAEVVLDWMRRPARIRPGLALLYFGDVDVSGHRHGPGSPKPPPRSAMWMPPSAICAGAWRGCTGGSTWSSCRITAWREPFPNM